MILGSRDMAHPKLLLPIRVPNLNLAYLSTSLLSLRGCEHICTTADHPAANGLIERWHRTLKAAIMCHVDKDWTCTMSTVLLELSCTTRYKRVIREIYVWHGTTYTCGEFFLPKDLAPDPNFFVDEF